jgi:dTDP-4-amino-4,6-dideoxygalactose transaminase
MGLASLPYMDEVISGRRKIYNQYYNLLSVIKEVELPNYDDIPQHNYAYFPISVNGDDGLCRDKLCDALNAKKIFPRKYFFPNVTDFSIYKPFSKICPVAEDVAKTVLCLPMYPGLLQKDVQRITVEILGFFNR